MATVGWDSGRKKTLTIANTATESDILDLGRNARGGIAYRTLDVLVMAPAALTGTVTVHVCDTDTGTFQPLTSGGSNVTIAAAKATPIVPLGARFMKLISGSSEGADRAFILNAVARNIER